MRSTLEMILVKERPIAKFSIKATLHFESFKFILETRVILDSFNLIFLVIFDEARIFSEFIAQE